MSRVLIIGLDGVGPAFFERAVAAGHFPFLGSLARDGALIPAVSTTPPVSTAAWTTISTGVGIGKHGVVDFFRRDLADYGFTKPGRLVSSQDVTWPRLYDAAGRAGLRSFVLNLPVTFPASPINGAMVTGVLTPPGNARGFYPPDFGRFLEGYRYDLEEPVPEDLAALCRELSALERQRSAVAAAAFRRDRYDLGLVVFTGPDRLFHRFFEEVYVTGGVPPAAAAYLKTLDEAAARVHDAFGDAVTLVCSDHGFGPGPDHAFYVNRVLRKAGLLAVGEPLGLSALNYVWGGLRRLAGADARLGVNAAATTAYGYPFYMRWGAVALNVRGEQPQGVVQPGDVAAACEDVISLILQQKRGDDAVATWAKRREELYDGPAVKGLPHVIFECALGFAVSEAKGPGPVVGRFTNALKRGDHDPAALLVIAGRQIKTGVQTPASVAAVAATAASALGLDASAMDAAPCIA